MSINTAVLSETPQEVIDRVGLKGRHWLIFTVVALILLADGMDITIVSHVSHPSSGSGAWALSRSRS